MIRIPPSPPQSSTGLLLNQPHLRRNLKAKDSLPAPTPSNPAATNSPRFPGATLRRHPRLLCRNGFPPEGAPTLRFSKCRILPHTLASFRTRFHCGSSLRNGPSPKVRNRRILLRRCRPFSRAPASLEYHLVPAPAFGKLDPKRRRFSSARQSSCNIRAPGPKRRRSCRHPHIQCLAQPAFSRAAHHP